MADHRHYLGVGHHGPGHILAGARHVARRVEVDDVDRVPVDAGVRRDGHAHGVLEARRRGRDVVVPDERDLDRSAGRENDHATVGADPFARAHERGRHRGDRGQGQEAEDGTQGHADECPS
jgi:hypothetical protein